MSGDELLALTGVGKTYGSVRALRDVSLALHAGEISCVLGDNGAGKSTLIKIIAGLHRHDEGSYTIAGEEVRLDSPGRPWTGASRPSTRISPSSR